MLALWIARPAAGESPRIGEAWIRVDTTHFVLFGNATERKIRETGLELERLRATLGQMTKSGDARATAPTTVFVFGSDQDFIPYKPLWQGRAVNAAGWFIPGQDENRIALSARWNSDPRAVIYHEYLHDFCNANLPPAPLWFAEGLAEFYSTFSATDEEARIGRPIENHIHQLRRAEWMPLERLFSVDQSSPDYNEADKQSVFYAESWALVHYLRNGNPNRKGQLGRLFEAARQGPLSEDAFRAVTGSDFRSFEDELRVYVDGSRFQYVTLDIQATFRKAANVRPVSHAEMLARLGGLLAAQGFERFGEAERHLLSALEIESENPTALSGLAQLRADTGEIQESESLLARAIASGSADANAWFRYGELRLGRLSGRSWQEGEMPSDVCQDVERAREAFARAYQLAPEMAIARARFGETYFFEDPAQVAPGIAALEEASARLPARRDISSLLDMLRRRRDEGSRPIEPSDQVSGEFGGQGPTPSSAGSRTLPAENDVLGRINAFLAASKWDEAENLIEAAIRDTKNPQLGSLISQEFERIRPKLARNRLTARYNRGVLHMKQQRFEEALAELRVVAAAKDAPDLASAAATMVKKIEAELARRRG